MNDLFVSRVVVTQKSEFVGYAHKHTQHDSFIDYFSTFYVGRCMFARLIILAFCFVGVERNELISTSSFNRNLLSYPIQSKS